METSNDQAINLQQMLREDDVIEEKPDPRTFRPDLYHATMKNETNQVLCFLLDQVPCDFVDPKTKYTALHWASMHGNVVLVKNILESGGSAAYHKQVRKLKLRKSQTKLEDIQRNNHYDGDNGVAEEKSRDDVNHDSDDDLENVSQDMDNDDSIDFTKNTPLLWAAYKGHFEVVWLLLIDGYSSNDVDDNGNNALHMAACSGNINVVRILIADGANSNLVNLYKNLPIDMATSKEIREILSTAMEKYASNTYEDTKEMNKQNIKMYKGLIEELELCIKESMLFENKPPDKIRIMMQQLEDRLRISKEWQLDSNLLNKTEKIIRKMEVTLELISDMESLKLQLPMSSQLQYSRYVTNLERTIKKAEQMNLNRELLVNAHNLVLQAQAEYWLSTCIKKVIHIECADEENEHDMIKLKQAIDKYESRPCSVDLIVEGMKLYKRLNSELGLNRAVRNVPVVRLPIDNPPAGYWQPCDTGKIRETPEYPNPPSDPPGEYIWEPSQSYAELKYAITKLHEYYDVAAQVGTNERLVAIAKDKITKAEKELKALEVKNTADHAAAIEAVMKLAKKLKKKKKAKKSGDVKSPRPTRVTAANESETENEE